MDSIDPISIWIFILLSMEECWNNFHTAFDFVAILLKLDAMHSIVSLLINFIYKIMAKFISFKEFLYFFVFRGMLISFNPLIVETPKYVSGN